MRHLPNIFLCCINVLNFDTYVKCTFATYNRKTIFLLFTLWCYEWIGGGFRSNPIFLFFIFLSLSLSICPFLVLHSVTDSLAVVVIYFSLKLNNVIYLSFIKDFLWYIADLLCNFLTVTFSSSLSICLFFIIFTCFSMCLFVLLALPLFANNLAPMYRLSLLLCLSRCSLCLIGKYCFPFVSTHIQYTYRKFDVVFLYKQIVFISSVTPFFRFYEGAV